MKIQPSSDSRVASTASNGVERRNGAAKPAAGVGAQSGASVTLSDLSAKLKAGVAAAGGAEFDQAKVESIKQAISDGKLKVNPEVIADKLIANAIALTGKNNG